MQNTQLEELLSWRLATELWRRFPHQYGLLETHPCGGQYDCLSFYSFDGGPHSVLDINRNGSVHVFKGRSPQSWPDWLDRMAADPRAFLDDVTAAMGMVALTPLPRSTPSTISFRFACEFLTHSLARSERWECRNGFCDTSGCDCGVRTEWFDCFPDIETARRPQGLVGRMLAAAYGYWFLVRDGEPMLCLDMAGCLYKRDGAIHDLAASYAQHGRIWPVIAETALDLLP